MNRPSGAYRKAGNNAHFFLYDIIYVNFDEEDLKKIR